MKVDVGQLDDFSDGEVTIVVANGREIGIVRWSDDVFAVANLCAHQRGPLCRGSLSPRLESREPGAMELAEGAPVIACPWHGWEFDVRTGRAVWDEGYAVRTYPVQVENGRILLDLAPRRQAAR
jgi:nitrite reductase/ring-hydroxylating ferredoxin subunit